MKIANDTHIYESSIRGEKAAFKIATSPKAFQILSANLYSDRPYAIVRELLCNALDAHKAAGTTDTPVEVTLPTRLRPQFSVKDYGTGLSHSAVMELYTTYFASDKTHTNELTGGLGLGSKSPFAYTDQFTVVSRYNGRCRTYQAFIAEDGTPSITLVADVESHLRNGLEVIVPVKQEDVDKFREGLQRFLQFLDINIQISGGEISRAAPIDQIELDGVRLQLFDLKTQRTDSNLKFYIEQGGVTYPAPSHLPISNLVSTFLHATYMIDVYAVLHVPIGTFSIAPSREALSPTPQELAQIPKLIEKMVLAYTTKVRDSVKVEHLSPLEQVYALRDHPMWWFFRRAPKYAPVLQQPIHRTAEVSIITTGVHRDRSRRAKVSTFEELASEFPKTNHDAIQHVLWRRPNAPFRKTIESYSSGRYLMIEASTEDEVREVLESIGLPNVDVVELDHAQRQKRQSKHVGTKAEYSVVRARTDHCAGWTRDIAELASTADEMIYAITQEPDTILFVGTHREFRIELAAAAEGRILMPGQDILRIDVPAAHTRVRRALREKGGISTADELRRRLKFDEATEQLVAAVHLVRPEITDLADNWCSVHSACDAPPDSPALMWLWWIDARINYLQSLSRAWRGLKVQPSRSAVREIRRMIGRIRHDVTRVRTYLKKLGVDPDEFLQGLRTAIVPRLHGYYRVADPGSKAIAQAVFGKAPFLRKL